METSRKGKVEKEEDLGIINRNCKVKKKEKKPGRDFAKRKQIQIVKNHDY